MTESVAIKLLNLYPIKQVNFQFKMALLLFYHCRTFTVNFLSCCYYYDITTV